jgi:hypothetical protein
MLEFLYVGLDNCTLEDWVVLRKCNIKCVASLGLVRTFRRAFSGVYVPYKQSEFCK